jgi:antitoxin VapB
MKTTKIIRDRAGQAVRLPEEFQFSGKEVLIKRLGVAVILLPKGETWGGYMDSVIGFRPGWPGDRPGAKRHARTSAK